MQETVLIISNDSPQPSSMERTIAQRLGYITMRSYSSEEGIRFIKSSQHSRPDLVLMDLDMSSREEIIRVIREIKNHTPYVPIVVLTHYGDDATAAQAIEVGASDFLPKPVTFERLKISLRNVLHIQRLSRELERLKRSDGSAQPSVPSNVMSISEGQRTLKAIEREAIIITLNAAGGCMTRAARSLGIGRSTLYRRLHDLEIEGYISRPNQATRPMMSASALESS